MNANLLPAWLSAFALSAAAFLAACSDTTSPGVEPEVTNVTDSFEFQVTNVRNLTDTYSYTWVNTGSQATVNQATTVTAGSVTLTISDADGTQVYSRSLADNGTFVTDIGATGDWTIIVAFSAASGTLNFRVEARRF
jgi:hypothetical protein